MIETNFMEECENCPHLEVTKNSLELTAWGESRYSHTITCEHIETCQLMKAHLRKEMQKNGN